MRAPIKAAKHPLERCRRWAAIFLAFGLSSRELAGLTAASLRGGGAILLQEVTEDHEYVRRWGRWSMLCACEIYVQVVSGQEYLSDLGHSHRACLRAFAEQAPRALEETIGLLQEGSAAAFCSR